jgi:ABC-2 type transport system permease protein
MKRFFDVAIGVWWRQIHIFVTNPMFLVPALIFPLFFFTSFVGGLSGIAKIPGFDYPPGYTAFQFAFVIIQASAFGGVFTGFSVAADFENGFARRLMLAAPNRLGMVGGYAMTALTRAAIVWTMLTTIALIVGVRFHGGFTEVVGLYTLALVLNLAAVLFATGVATRLRTMQAGPAMQMPVFLLLFLAPAYVPFDLLEGWIKSAARYNPITPIVELARDLIAGGPDFHLVGFAAVGTMALAFAAWAITGMRSAERAG